MALASSDLALLCRELVVLARRLDEQERALTAQAERLELHEAELARRARRLAALEDRIAGVAQPGGASPRPLDIPRPAPRGRRALVENLVASFEDRVSDPGGRTEPD